MIVEGNLNVNSDVGIILPTYSEAVNIEKIIVEIPSLKFKACLLVIDDSSPDSTSRARHIKC